MIDWQAAPAEQLGFSAARLGRARQWWEEVQHDAAYRVLAIRGGRVAVDWTWSMEHDAQVPIASATKSVICSMLGIAVHDGAIGSMDDLVVEYYPEMMDVPPGRGPKPGRHAYEPNAAITFRHLASQTSGYLKPGEAPGKVFHYQTYGMTVLGHAIAKAYGMYDASRDEPSGPGFPLLLERKLRDPIGAAWRCQPMNFDAPAGARLAVFGDYPELVCSSRDLARLGLLWLRGGRWDDRQVIPEEWMRQATSVADLVEASTAPGQRQYGLGFWSNSRGELWPQLPRDSFGAWGGGAMYGGAAQYVWVCPSLDLVIVISPGRSLSGERAASSLSETVAPMILDAIDDQAAPS